MKRYLTRPVRYKRAREPQLRMARLRLLMLLGALSVITAATIKPAYSSDIELYKLYAHMKVLDDKQYRCLVILWRKESNWNPTAQNKHSSAYGIPQLLKMKETNPFKQIDLGLKYLHNHRVYKGDTCKALDTHNRKGHY